MYLPLSFWYSFWFAGDYLFASSLLHFVLTCSAAVAILIPTHKGADVRLAWNLNRFSLCKELLQDNLPKRQSNLCTNCPRMFSWTRITTGWAEWVLITGFLWTCLADFLFSKTALSREVLFPPCTVRFSLCVGGLFVCCNSWKWP